MYVCDKCNICNACISVCVLINMYACMHVCMYVCMHVCVHVCMHTSNGRFAVDREFKCIDLVS